MTQNIIIDKEKTFESDNENENENKHETIVNNDSNFIKM